MRRRRWALASCAFILLSGAAIAKKNPVIGGAEMLPGQDVVDNLEKSSDHTEFVKRIKAAHLVDTLKGTGPYTVFAPVNAAFANTPALTGDALVRQLTHQVVPGNYTSKTLRRMLKRGNGTVSLKTMAGDSMSITSQEAHAMKADIMEKNGTLYVVDALAVHPPR